MANIILELEQKKLISPPSWLGFNTVYLAVMGSNAYGVTSESSDYDVCGFAVPKKEIMFPHLAGVILVPRSKEQGGGWSSFDQEDAERFTQYQQHHVNDPSACAGKGREYDLTVFNIVKYFKLLMENNPNMIDSLFVPYECVLHSTEVGNMVRENRHIFLHKGAYPNFKGYAYSQMHKMASKSPKEGSKRYEIRKEYGMDLKYAMHLIRLLDECEQLLLTGDLDLRKNKEQLKAIRRGEMSEADIKSWASEKEKHLEKLYSETKLPEKPPVAKIKQLLMNCLEHHYGSLEKCVVQPDKAALILEQIRNLIN